MVALIITLVRGCGRALPPAPPAGWHTAPRPPARDVSCRMDVLAHAFIHCLMRGYADAGGRCPPHPPLGGTPPPSPPANDVSRRMEGSAHAYGMPRASS